MIENQPFTLDALRRAYSEGLRPEAVVAEGFRRLDKADDPGIFIHQARDEALAAARALAKPDGRPLWGIPFAVKDNIDVAGMPTTAACPDFAYMPERDAFVVSAPARGRCDPTWQDQSRPVRNRPCRHAHAVSGTPERARPRDRARRLLLRFGGGGGARHRGVCARHGHGRFRARAGGPERHRGIETDAWSVVGDGRRAGLSNIGYDLGIRPDRCGCLECVRRGGRP